MSKKHLTLADLKKQGLKLSKADAQELHSPINHIAQRGDDENIVFDGEDNENDVEDFEAHEDKTNEKLIWEFNSGSEGWCVIDKRNLDEDGNLKGIALNFYNDVKDHSDQGLFRQIPASQVGEGDSTGKVKVLLEINDDDLAQDQSKENFDFNGDDDALTDNEQTKGEDDESSNIDTEFNGDEEDHHEGEQTEAPKKRGRQPKSK